MVNSTKTSTDLMRNRITYEYKHCSFARGGGYLVYFADGMCTPFRVSISLLFSKTGYRIRALFLKPVADGEILQE